MTRCWDGCCQGGRRTSARQPHGAPGEARWQAAPLGRRDLEALHRKVPFVPNPVDEPTLVLWGRGGVHPEVRNAGTLGFSVEDVVA